VTQHAKQRFQERYPDAFEAVFEKHKWKWWPYVKNGILSRIDNRKTNLLEVRYPNGFKVFRVRWQKRTYELVTNKKVDGIITFLPKDSWSFNGWKERNHAVKVVGQPKEMKPKKVR